MSLKKNRHRNKNDQRQQRKEQKIRHGIGHGNVSTEGEKKTMRLGRTKDKQRQRTTKIIKEDVCFTVTRNEHPYLQATCDIQTQFNYTGWLA